MAIGSFCAEREKNGTGWFLYPPAVVRKVFYAIVVVLLKKSPVDGLANGGNGIHGAKLFFYFLHGWNRRSLFYTAGVGKPHAPELLVGQSKKNDQHNRQYNIDQLPFCFFLFHFF